MRPPRALAVASLVAIQLGVFLFQLSLSPPELEELLNDRGLVPRDLLRGTSPRAWLAPLTSLFLHASPAHLLANLACLALFGAGLERELGALRFAAFWLACGLAAAAAHVAADPSAWVPALGASGAVAGLVGGQARLAPGGRVAGMPALAAILGWLVIQLLSSALAPPDAASGVAGFAHLGGFLAGFALAPLFRPGPRQEEGGAARSCSGSGGAQAP
jgi:membrane associated rhomboid family serine protease